MFCANCGNKLEDDSLYCEACGTPVVSKPKAVSGADMRGEVNLNSSRNSMENMSENTNPSASGATMENMSENTNLNTPDKRGWVEPVFFSIAGVLAVVLIVLNWYDRNVTKEPKDTAQLTKMEEQVQNGNSTDKGVRKNAETQSYIFESEDSSGEGIDDDAETSIKEAANTEKSGIEEAYTEEIDINDTTEVATNEELGMVTLADFMWLGPEQLDGILPEGAERITDFADLIGEWKCYLIDDPKGEYGSYMERLLTVEISGTESQAKLVANWFYVHDGSIGEGYDDDTPASSYSGIWSNGQLDTKGSGAINITDFYSQDGHQYAIGTYTWPDGMPAFISLVRP